MFENMATCDPFKRCLISSVFFSEITKWSIAKGKVCATLPRRYLPVAYHAATYYNIPCTYYLSSKSQQHCYLYRHVETPMADKKIAHSPSMIMSTLTSICMYISMYIEASFGKELMIRLRKVTLQATK
jgi:hypothetical protein